MAVNAVGGAFFVLLGVLLLVFNGPIARLAAKFQNRVGGYDLGEREVRLSRIANTALGILAIVIGAMLSLPYLRQ